MKKMTRNESTAVAKLATQLRTLLNNLAMKYYDENEFGPTADLYAKDYEALLRLQRDSGWWLD